MTRFTALLGILCVAVLCLCPAMAMADGPHHNDHHNDSHSHITINSNTGNAVIVSGHHNTVSIHIERTRHDNHRRAPRTSAAKAKYPRYEFRPTTSGLRGPDCDDCEPTRAAHNARVNMWLASMRR